MQKTFAEIIEAMGGRVQGRRRHRRRESDRAGRQHHPRGRRRHHGSDPQELRDERMVPDLGREESLRHRRRAVSLECRQESHAHDHGARLARRRTTFSIACGARSSRWTDRTTLKWIRRTAIKWPLPRSSCGRRPRVASSVAGVPAPKGYGTDPDLLTTYQPGELWPLTLHRRAARAPRARSAMSSSRRTRTRRAPPRSASSISSTSGSVRPMRASSRIASSFSMDCSGSTTRLTDVSRRPSPR